MAAWVIVYSMQLALQRANISEEVAEEIRRRIVDGTLAPGSRINEVHLARDLGVSRTPLREALAGLIHEGALTGIPRIGAFVKSLTIEECEQVYSIRALLDPEALRLAGIPPKPRIDQLERLNAHIASAKNAEKIIALDDEWHLLLIEGCPNRVLLDLISDFISRTRRYELALMREQKKVSIASEEHNIVIAELRRADLNAATKALRRNLQSGLEPIRRWLKQREGAQR